MLRTMIDNWWLFACRAIFALLFAGEVFFVEGANLPLATAGICPCFHCCFVWAIGIWRRGFYARRWIETIKP